MNTVAITCPACFETFEVNPPPPEEVPCTVDYDCEICCRPMIIEFRDEDGEVTATAHGLAE